VPTNQRKWEGNAVEIRDNLKRSGGEGRGKTPSMLKELNGSCVGFEVVEGRNCAQTGTTLYSLKGIYRKTQRGKRGEGGIGIHGHFTT